MNLAFEELADNPVIDELVRWPPRTQAIRSIRACNVLFRKPFIEVTLADGEVFQRHFARPDFAEHWAEASVILETLTDIELVAEFAFTPIRDRSALVDRILDCRRDCIVEAEKMFEQGMYRQYLSQFGEDYRDLPEVILDHMETARQALAES